MRAATSYTLNSVIQKIPNRFELPKDDGTRLIENTGLSKTVFGIIHRVTSRREYLRLGPKEPMRHVKC